MKRSTKKILAIVFLAGGIGCAAWATYFLVALVFYSIYLRAIDDFGTIWGIYSQIYYITCVVVLVISSIVFFYFHKKFKRR